MVELNGASKSYGSHLALRELTLSLSGPGIVGLLGPNGSGKTTTLRLMAGFFPPTRGRVLFDGQDATVSAPARVGYLPEQAPLYPEMTVAHYLTFVARLKGLGRAAARAAADEVMGKLSLGDRRESLVGHLSRGFKQRVGLAQALVHRPTTILLDEPTAGLDPVQIEEARSVIRDAARSALVLMSTHLLPEVAQMCGRVVVLREGALAGELSVAGLPGGSAVAASRWRITVRGDAAHLGRLVEQVGLKPEAPPTTVDGANTLELEAPDAAAIEALAAAVVKAGMGLRGLERVTVDVFREYARLQAS